MELISARAFAKKMRVAPAVVYRAIQCGRVLIYDKAGNPLPPGASGPKFVDFAEAKRRWRATRAKSRHDNEPRSLVETRQRKLTADAQMQELRLAERHGALIPREAAMATIRALGKALRRTVRAFVNSAEELHAAARNETVAEFTTVLKRKMDEVCNSVADMLTTEADALVGENSEIPKMAP